MNMLVFTVRHWFTEPVLLLLLNHMALQYVCAEHFGRHLSVLLRLVHVQKSAKHLVSL